MVLKKIHSLSELTAEIRQLETRSKVAEAHLKRWFASRVRRLKKELTAMKRAKAKTKVLAKKKTRSKKTVKKTKRKKKR